MSQPTVVLSNIARLFSKQANIKALQARNRMDFH